MRLTLVLAIALAPTLAQAEAAPLTCDQPTYLTLARWATAPTGTTTGSVVYRLSTTLATDITGSATSEAIERAVSAWNNVSCTGGKPSIQLSRGTNYSAADNGGTADIDNHIIYWENDTWEDDTDTIALTSTMMLTDSGRILTSDMAFNGVGYDFRAKGSDAKWYGCTTTGSTASVCYDVELITLHELGHFIGLDHVPCTDAVMFFAADPATISNGLSKHEKAGVCALYPPRSTTSGRVFGEACDNATSCATDLTCVIDNTGEYGWCSTTCNDSTDCSAAYYCASAGESAGFCKPGEETDASNAGVPTDLCASCTVGDTCSTGVCVTDGVHTLGICTFACDASGDSGVSAMCPIGMDCIASGDTSVCWPRDGFNCTTAGTLKKINEECYDQAAGAYTSCADGLVCFVFREQATGTHGSCVEYCNTTDYPCGDSEQTCCFGVDTSGGCTTTTAAGPAHGGCFQLQREGQSCYRASQSVCEAGLECIQADTENIYTARCYRHCDTGSCGANQLCLAYDNGLKVCCNKGTGQANQPACEPAAKTYEVGVACTSDNDCASGLCLTGRGGSACTRLCDTTYPCPGNIDVNNDSLADGGFNCIAISPNTGTYCWPKEGPASVPDPHNVASANEGCSCSAAEDGSSRRAATWVLILSILASLMMWRRRWSSRVSSR